MKIDILQDHVLVILTYTGRPVLPVAVRTHTAEASQRVPALKLTVVDAHRTLIFLCK